jgi:REP element-mobilizing transposase RayT
MGSSFLQLYYHVVWTTYKRFQWIDEEIEKDLRKLIKERISGAKSELLAFGCTSDHVHLIFKLHPTVSIAVIVGEIKGYTSYVISNLIKPDLGFRWQGGYGAFTVSRWDLTKVIKYINNQKEHHKQDTLIQEWELSVKKERALKGALVSC